MLKMIDGTIVRGESNIPNFDNRIQKVYYEEEVTATPQAIEALANADLIVIGIGSLYTSVIPNLIIEGITDAIRQSKANCVYFCNAMTQPGETDNYSLEDHVEAIEAHSYKGIIQTVFAYEDDISEEVLSRYNLEGSNPGNYP